MPYVNRVVVIDMSGVRKKAAITFSNRQFRNNAEHSGDRNWLQIDGGAAFKTVQELLEQLTCKK